MRRPLALLIAAALLACSPSRQDAPVAAERTPLPTRGPERYVAIGASDTVGVGAADPATGSWPARIAARLASGSTFTNLGVSGTLAAVARSQQLPAAIAARPTLVTVSADGFHPSDRGYQLIADRFLSAMRRAGIRLRG